MVSEINDAILQEIARDHITGNISDSEFYSVLEDSLDKFGSVPNFFYIARAITLAKKGMGVNGSAKDNKSLMVSALAYDSNGKIVDEVYKGSHIIPGFEEDKYVQENTHAENILLRELTDNFSKPLAPDITLVSLMEPCIERSTWYVDGNKSSKNAPYVVRNPESLTLEIAKSHPLDVACCDLISAMGVERVVYGDSEQTPHMRDRGLALMRQKGVKVIPDLTFKTEIADIVNPFFRDKLSKQSQ